jgi:hypothetical protein
MLLCRMLMLRGRMIEGWGNGLGDGMVGVGEWDTMALILPGLAFEGAFYFVERWASSLPSWGFVLSLFVAFSGVGLLCYCTSTSQKGRVALAGLEGVAWGMLELVLSVWVVLYGVSGRVEDTGDCLVEGLWSILYYCYAIHGFPSLITQLCSLPFRILQHWTTSNVMDVTSWRLMDLASGADQAQRLRLVT